jgi:hypothetical protein
VRQHAQYRARQEIQAMKNSFRWIISFALVALLTFAWTAIAKPPGVDTEVGKMIFKFNLIGYPEGKTYDGNCGGGRRIFVSLLGEFTMNREAGKSNFGIRPDPMFDAELEDIIGSLDTNNDFRIAEFRVYENN